MPSKQKLKQVARKLSGQKSPSGVAGGKKPGKPCGKSFIKADYDCNPDKIKAAAQRLKGTKAGLDYANKVRAYKGLQKLKAAGKTTPAKPKAVKAQKPTTPTQQINEALRNGDYAAAVKAAGQVYQSAKSRAASDTEFYQGIAAGNGTTEDFIMKELWAQNGYDGKPKQVTKAAIDKAYTNGQHVAYRAVGSSDARFKQHFDNFKNGDYFAGHGIYGHGTYVAYAVQGGSWGRGVASNSASAYGSGLIRMALAKDSKIVDQRNNKIDVIAVDQGLKNYLQQTGDRAGYRRARAVLIGDASSHGTSGRLATAQGYDAITLSDSYDPTYMVLLNRSKVSVQKTPGTKYQQ
jgi:hypothetical protein